MGQLKVKVIHASVTQKMLSRMQQDHVLIWFGLC